MVLSMDRWVGKVAVVTGASVGIGASIAEQLVNHGVQVVGLARRVELIEENATKLKDRKGKLYGFKADVTKDEDVIKAFDWVEQNIGPIHILVNNAGVAFMTNLSDFKTEVFKQIFDLNVLGLCIATREAVKRMKANNINGHIIQINSRLGHTCVNSPGLNIYPASKHAVRALVETLRQELARNGSKIKVTSLSPGLTESEMTIQSPDQNRVQAFKGRPILKAEDISDGAIYVLSTPEHVQVHELLIVANGEA